MSSTQIKYNPLPTAVPTAGTTAEEVRTATTTDEFPCRRCQSNSSTGDIMRLISYNPFEDTEASRMSPYTGPGPIFVHDKQCTTYMGSEIAESHRARTFSLRGYDVRHMAVCVGLVQGEEVDRKAKEMFKNESIDYLHAYHVAHGCFAFKIERAV